jgi:hypothetical protein
MKKLSLFALVLVITACGGGGGGGGGGGDTVSTNNTKTGFLIDSYVNGVEYYLNNKYSGLTKNGGSFTYQENDTVSFKVGGIEIGIISTVPDDGRVTMQDIFGVQRNWSDHPRVINLATFLQSLDDDNNPDNGINISSSIKQKYTQTLKLTELDYSEIVVLINTIGKTVRTKKNVQLHLESVMISNGLTPLILDENTIPPYYDTKVGLPPFPQN